MSRVTQAACPDPQTSYDFFATRLALETDPSDVQADLKEDVARFTVVDVRDRADYDRGHILGAVHFPYSEMTKESLARQFGPPDDLAAPDHGIFVLVGWDWACNAPDKAAVRMAPLGYQVKVMRGGMAAWAANRYPVQSPIVEA